MASRTLARTVSEMLGEIIGHAGALWVFTCPHLKQIFHAELDALDCDDDPLVACEPEVCACKVEPLPECFRIFDAEPHDK